MTNDNRVMEWQTKLQFSRETSPPATISRLWLPKQRQRLQKREWSSTVYTFPALPHLPATRSCYAFSITTIIIRIIISRSNLVLSSRWMCKKGVRGRVLVLFPSTTEGSQCDDDGALAKNNKYRSRAMPFAFPTPEGPSVCCFKAFSSTSTIKLSTIPKTFRL